jgi:anti-sigma regulatory factor (Ser/Thr protein kinase)
MRSDELQLELEPRPASAAQARRFVARALAQATPLQREVGILLTSELVTNALLYARGRITLRIEQRAGTARVIVHDDSPQEIRPRQVTAEATSGRGLALVAQLSGAWGVHQIEGDGKEVWFELPEGDRS